MHNENMEQYMTQEYWGRLWWQTVRREFDKEAPQRDRARIGSLRQPQSGAWMRLTPAEASSARMSSPVLQRLLRWRCALQIVSPEEEGRCPACDEKEDPFGDHRMVCRMGGFYK